MRTQTDLDEYYNNLYKVRQDLKHVERQINLYAENYLIQKRQMLSQKLKYWLKKINILEGMYEPTNN